MKASKLVFNNSNFTSVSGVAQTGIFVPREDGLIENSCYFGLEEWINNPMLLSRKFGYIDSYRRTTRTGVENRIVLFMFNPIDKHIYYVGNLYGVQQLTDQDINQIRDNLLNENWLDIVQRDFNNIGDQRLIQNHNEYMKCWNSERIVGPTGECFVVNIKYKKLEIFPEKYWVDLTILNHQVNKKWRKLIDLYDVPKKWETYFK
jgi:hypothetical protein